MVMDIESVAGKIIWAAGCIARGRLDRVRQITPPERHRTVRDGQGGCVIPGATGDSLRSTRKEPSRLRWSRMQPAISSSNLRAGLIHDFRVDDVRRSNTLKRSSCRSAPGSASRPPPGASRWWRDRIRGCRIRSGRRWQSTSAERSFTIATDAGHQPPIAGRSFTQLAALAPGVTGTTRIGDRSSTGGGDTNIQMDGVSTMDTGSNRAIIDLNVESIAEVKVLVSSYQAEYGRSSGLQITAVTKSGTNRFRGSVYDVERNSDWNANSKTNILNDDPKNVCGSANGAIRSAARSASPGGNNKLFFFYTQEFEPRTGATTGPAIVCRRRWSGRGIFRNRLTTGEPVSVHQEPGGRGHVLGANQTACTRTAACSGAFPASQLYQTGLNILKMYRCRTSRPDSPTTSRSPGRRSRF